MRINITHIQTEDRGLLLFGKIVWFPYSLWIDWADNLPFTNYTCSDCGKQNNHSKWMCENCSDPNGGDQNDD